MTSFTLVDYLLRHFIRSGPIKTSSVCFGHDGPRRRMMATGPRVDVIKDYSTFLRCYAFLTNSSHTFSVQLSPYHGKGLRSTDNLSSLFFVLREFFPKDIRDIWYCPIWSDHQNFHDQVDHCWDFNLSRVRNTLRLWSFIGKRIFYD